jgi:hypothetical protein
MSASVAIAEKETNIHYGISSSRQDHVNDARPRKRGDDAPSAGRLAAQSLNVLLQVRVGPSRLRVSVSQHGSTISQRTVMNNAG